jgi:hypothetical protein
MLKPRQMDNKQYVELVINMRQQERQAQRAPGS